MEAEFVVVGGGIAGVSCAESLSILAPLSSIILISESALIKTATNIFAITKTLTSFEVKESSFQSLSGKYPNIKVIHDFLTKVEDTTQTIETKSNLTIHYKYLCLCTGASPKLITQAVDHPEILGIRDTESVETLVEKLSKSKKIAIVGNGGIATELIYQIKNVEVHWIIKDKHISSSFVDPGAGEFFKTVLSATNTENGPSVSKRMKYNEESMPKSGAALGPDWYKHFSISGSKSEGIKEITIHYESEVEKVVRQKSGTLEVTLGDGNLIFCDVIVSATGVTPNLNFIHYGLNLSEEGFINVDEFMRTNKKNIYAAGDVCNANWNAAPHWFQMKLWTQARQMGSYAAKCMYGHSVNEEILQDFCFEIFSHSTKLFGFKVILLGLFNGQKLGTNYEILLRMTKGEEYIKLVLQDNKLQGALLIGDTDLEEMCENLILNQLDLSPYGDDILNPNIDIEDYFD